MPTQGAGVFPIRRGSLKSDAGREVAEFAYNLWLARGFRGGSPEEDLITAMREGSGEAPGGLFLVPKRKPNLYQFPAMRRHMRGTP
jgi:hypothetical protein